jgi:2-polyprenyl-3-methyl-5-hydroxy-6-metoxy-1,4-benzoquinol methylase
MSHHLAAAVLLLVGWEMVGVAGETPSPTVTPPPMTQEQQRQLAELSPEARELVRYRTWLAVQPPDLQGDQASARRAYGAHLAASGQAKEHVAAILDILGAAGGWSDVDRWNLVLTAGTPSFNTAPNAFLVEMVKGRTPGTALDVGMGQGRNAVFLAQRGWRVTGFDLAEHAVALAQETATKAGVALDAVVDDDDHFDWGSNRYDLIVMTYVRVRGHVDQVLNALKPGGMVVIEGFHRDAARTQAIGGDVLFDSNELLQLFAAFRVRRYEDARGAADFGQGETSVVRLCAEKP